MRTLGKSYLFRTTNDDHRKLCDVSKKLGTSKNTVIRMAALLFIQLSDDEQWKIARKFREAELVAEIQEKEIQLSELRGDQS